MSDMPDFDSMSEEEMMKWMETLAKRQGADMETLVTDADLVIDEVDPDTVDMEAIGEYKPHGMSDERWAEMQAEEAAKKAQKEAAKAQETPKSDAPLPPPEETFVTEPVIDDEPVIEAVAESTLDVSGDMPDFDSMSEDEMMAWMNTLAVRQGADLEEIVGDADMDIPEIDPDTVDMEAIGEYKPHGMSDERWAEMQAEEAAKKAQKEAAKAAETPTSAPVEEEFELEPVAEVEYVADEDDEIDLSFLDMDDDVPELDLDDIDDYDEEDEDELEPATLDFLEEMAEGDEADPLPMLDLDALDDIEETESSESVGDGLAWLESLAAGDSPADVPDIENLDLGDLGSLSAVGEDADTSAVENPMDWLESLAETPDSSGGLDSFDFGELNAELTGLPTEDEASAQPAVTPVDDDVDPVDWLESLAKRQGADTAELVGAGDLDIPLPPELQDGGPGYTEYTVEDEMEDTQPAMASTPVSEIDPSELDNPADWLDALAANTGIGMTTSVEDDDEVLSPGPENEGVIDALNRGEDVTPEAIEAFFHSQFDRAEQVAQEQAEMDFSVEDHDPEAEAVPTELPDWLQEQIGGPIAQAEAEEPVVDEVDESVDELFGDLFGEDEADDVEIPDWLLDAEGDGGSADDVSDIFATDDAPEPATAGAPTDTMELLKDDDAWVAGMALEQNENQLEEWYQERLEAIGETDGSDDDTGFTPELIAVVTEPEPQPVMEVTSSSNVALEPANLPKEEDLDLGDLETVPAWMNVETSAPVSISDMPPMEVVDDIFEDDIPDWLQGAIEDEPIAVTESAETEDLPDWLRDTDVTIDEVPDWLLDTGDIDSSVEDVFIAEEAPPIEMPPVTVTPTPSSPRPPVLATTPLPQVTPAVDVSLTLNDARQNINSGNMDEALQNYEAIVRANAQLDDVTNDLRKLTNDNAYKQNAGVYRVLGDALMRKGDLQEALDTYRRALNML